MISLRISAARVQFACALCAICAFAMCIASCKSKDPDVPKGPDTVTKTQTLIDTTGVPAFDGKSAFDFVAKQVAFGPRNPGSPGAQKAIQYYLSELRKYADTVTQQTFTQAGYDGAQLHLTNIIASFNPKATYRILLLAHWDTRPRAEQDSNVAKRNQPIIGANDGGSGVAVLLELARIMKSNPPKVGIDLLLVDGEDYGKEDDIENYFLGARYFAKNLPVGYKPQFGVLLDMVGDKNAKFFKEERSVFYAPQVVETLWKTAVDLGLPHFIQNKGKGISDDHGPLNDVAGIQTIDIIDAEMVGNQAADPARNYWHTHHDTLDKISPETLQTVGRLLLHMIYKLAPASA